MLFYIGCRDTYSNVSCSPTVFAFTQSKDSLVFNALTDCILNHLLLVSNFHKMQLTIC